MFTFPLPVDADALIKELNNFSMQNDSSGIETTLEKISLAHNIQNVELKDCFLDLLNQNTPNINLKTATAIADITKNSEQRAKFSNRDILEKLIELLNLSISRRQFDLIIQLCRCFGNICYSNDDARNIIFHFNGGKVFVDLFDISNNEIKDTEQLELFMKVRGGVMSNYLLGNEELSQKAIELKIIEKLKTRMKESSIGLEHSLPLFSILTEQVSELIFQPDILKLIIEILKTSNDTEVIEACLELLQCQSESDDVKLLLAQEGLCEHIFNSIEKYKKFTGSVDSKVLVKLSCDLIVLILTGDDAMHFLDKSSFLTCMKNWMNSDDVDLLTTSVLALGNFARTDDHCIKMVEEKLHVHLIKLLGKNNKSDSEVKLQHALLSAIRNLVIPKPNKTSVIEAGLVETILPMLELYQPPVIFKLLGTLRMLVDGQELLARKFLGDQKLISELIGWAMKSQDMIGVNSEASRLLASIVKNSLKCRFTDESAELVTNFVKVEGSVNVLVKMLVAAHLIMQNEALIALTLVSTCTKEKESLHEKLVSSDIGPALSEFIKKISELDRTTNEVVDNLKTFLSILDKSESLKKYLSDHNIADKLKTLPSIQELATL